MASDPQTVYVAMINDRHSDPEPEVFSRASLAISYAQGWASGAASRPEDIEESEVDGWLYHATYSCEGDSVWVIEKVLDGR